ncbi:MAG: endolytic transglycosylase MltG [Duncaniella sp.]|uniref:endolytic transglycosylase MltG n=1 Tax=Duncaniella sp. TaxID=2518496 RepID=UPI0023CAE4D5|nr:endolytic transglycosylase MltG [Duncaniella sp.]MDE6089658.1 endolytic transglycosylase MltG [Duncaniella sp.]
MATTKSSGLKSKKKKQQSWLHRHSLGLLIGVIALFAAGVSVLTFVFIPYSGRDGNSEWIYIPKDISQAAVKDSMKSSLGSSMGTRVYVIWKLMGGNSERSQGAYKVSPGQSALGISRHIAHGRQTPVEVRFNGTRTMKQLSERIASQLQCTPQEFMEACEDVLPDSGFTRQNFPAAFLPDSYEFYWSASPHNIVKRLLDYRNRFWNKERRAKAAALGLSPTEVATVASIVEEETAKADEKPKVARLYLNRLRKGMKLQADPTVKFATGDFKLRRILGKHLAIESPYNTYKHTGLPPGPIRVPASATIDAVLNAPEHNYIYMCAKEDFSGYHNFASDYQTHIANARRYQAELNRRGIH